MHVAFVCTGNICRSALAERITTAFAEELGRGDLTASSSGTAAVVGSAMDPRAAQALTDLGGHAGSFRARQFVPEHAAEADLVLALTRAHRRDVLQVAPRAMARTFTLLEARDLLAHLPRDLVVPPARDLDARGAALVAALGRGRAARGLVTPGDDDVLDPVGRSSAVHRAVADRIADALFPLLQTFLGTRAPALV
ncbi:hypothetical protein [Klenkia terrae]|uniref:protein-tyrosine-phosphatase n=1 Tax=Klenkia terrae TaxID=1052259 RepID=A0ABU8EBI4_9ACTN|nr:hypothetical protein [Klenkia terrae]SSC24194.1 protein-tyrosine phosphatase [Klenkia terrae]